jgi:hypothetical protein
MQIKYDAKIVALNEVSFSWNPDDSKAVEAQVTKIIKQLRLTIGDVVKVTLEVGPSIELKN